MFGIPIWAILLVSLIALVINLFASKRQDEGEQWWVYVLSFISVPVLMILMFVGAVLSIPYFSLYPERHATTWDFEGSPEQKLALHRYRQKCERRKFIRRVLEKCWILRDIQHHLV